ncbi:hypothetical protein TNCV_4548061 [Trichonephila clavipes]|nr:hypothetical protein TNCV_4548061 [Trichonephila clavipes]
MTSEISLKSLVLRCGCRRFGNPTFVYGLRNATMHSHSVVSPSDDTKYSGLWLQTWMLGNSLLRVRDIVELQPLRTVTNITLSRSGSSPNLATRRLKKLRNCLLTC